MTNRGSHGFFSLPAAFQTEIDDEDDDDGDDGFGGAGGEMKAAKAAGKLAQAVAAAAANSAGSAANDDSEEVMNEFNFLSNPDQVDSIKSAGGAGEEVGKGRSGKDFLICQVFFAIFFCFTHSDFFLRLFHTLLSFFCATPFPTLREPFLLCFLPPPPSSFPATRPLVTPTIQMAPPASSLPAIA